MAQETDYSPARFAAGVESFAESIPFPSAQRDFPAILFCSVLVESAGSAGERHCIGNTAGSESLARSVEDLLSQQAYTPAVIGGSRQDARMAFSVYFISDDAGDDVLVIPNLGLNRDQHGMNYSAPQGHDFPTTIDSGCSKDFTTVIELTVSRKGEAMRVAARPTPTRDRCLRKLLSYVRNTQYIPAMSNGKPVDARHYEVFSAAN